MDQIENLSLTERRPALSLGDVSAELQQMSLTAGGDRPGPGPPSLTSGGNRPGPGPPVCSDPGPTSTERDQAAAELGQMSLTSGGGQSNSECPALPPGCS